jgi:hypothetical protein
LKTKAALLGRWATVFLVAQGLLFAKQASAVRWQDQAERLQNVNASLLDAFPVGEPFQVPRSIEIKAAISLLPKVSPRVGGKEEKVPASPAHLVPTLQGNYLFLKNKGSGVGGHVWAGFLPPGGEKLFGISAKLTQYLAGFAGHYNYNYNAFEFFLPVGFQFTNIKVEGGITKTDAHDAFKASTNIFYMAPGVKIPAYSAWGSLLFGRKSTSSEFHIEEDATTIKIDDTLGDATFPLAIQGSLGWYYNGIQVGLSELWVPSRVLMPRLLLSYQYAF